MNLYELNAKLASYQMEFDEETGEWVNEKELDDLNLALEEKIEGICLWIKNLRAEAKAIKGEEANLKERREAKENEADRLESYVSSNLQGKPFETSKVKVTWRKSESVEILNEDAVPPSLLDIQVMRKPIKAEIKKRLKEAEAKGEEILWAKLNKNNNMTVK